MTSTPEDAGHAGAGLMGSRRPWLVSVGISAALHAAAILTLISWSQSVEVGDSGQLETISIQVTIATSIGAPEVMAIEEPREASKAEKASVRENQRPPASEEVAPLPPKEEAVPEKEPEEVKTASAGQAMAQIEAHQAASGTSAGEIEKYGREVTVALARSVPKGKGQKGKVTLSFLLNSDGKIARLEVVSPSGDASLDEAARNAVRKTVFPPPPLGLTDKQRTYVIPFRFR